MVVKRQRGSLLHETHPHAYAQISSVNNLSEADKHALTTGSDAKLVWECNNSCCETLHRWPAQVNKRTLRNQGCPFCSGRLTCKCRSIGTLFPELAFQLCDRLNGVWNAYNLSVSSQRNDIYWECREQCCETEHIWKSTVSNRSQGQGCPYCAINSITCACKSFLAVYPDIAATLHPTLNDGIDLETISPSSHKPLWWVEYCSYCATEMSWSAPPYNRIKTVGGSTLCKCRSLAALDADLAQEIDQALSPCDTTTIAANSNKSYYWKCDKHDSWTATVYNRYYHRKGCPGCNDSKLEVAMRSVLTELGLVFKAQMSFSGSKQKYDFAVYDRITDLKPAFLIELDGTQHFEPTTFGSKKKSAEQMFECVRRRDHSKDMLSKSERVSLLRIAHTHNEKSDMRDDVQEFIETKHKVDYVLMCAASDVYDKRDEKYGIFSI